MHEFLSSFLLSSTNFWASGYAKMDRPPLLLVHISRPKWNCNWKTANLFFHMLLNPTGGCFTYLACFQPMAAELTIRNGCKACKRLPRLHVLTQRGIRLTEKKWEHFVWWKAQVLRYLHLGTACFFRHRSEGVFAVPSSEAPFFGVPRLSFGWEHAAGQVLFVKLASCIAVFGGAWHANSPIEGGTEW